MKKIAIFQGYFLPHIGGVEKYTYNLAKIMYDKGYEVIIVTTKHEAKLEEKEVLDYATIYRLPIYKMFSSRYPIIKKDRKYKKVIEELKNKNIDSIILNTRFQLTTLVGAKFAKKNNIPCCLIEHGTSHFTVYNKVLDFFGHIYEHLLTKKIKTLVKDFYGVSKACNKWLEHYKIKAKDVFYNAVDNKEYELYKEDDKIKNNNGKIKILFAGRLLKDKGILLLINAFEELLKKYNNIELFVAGEGPLRGLISANKNLLYLGNLSHEQIMRLYNKVDIFINPSYSEGLPTSVLEAGLMKCSVIATPVGGTTEIIEEGISGIFCDITVDSIKEKLELLINDEKLSKRIKENIHIQILEKFTWNKTCEKILKTIKYK